MNKKAFTGIFFALAIAAGVAVPTAAVLAVKNNSKSSEPISNNNIVDSELDSFTKTNFTSLTDIANCIDGTTPSSTIISKLVANNVITQEYANNLTSVKVQYSPSNFQSLGNKVKLDYIFDLKDGTQVTKTNLDTNLSIVYNQADNQYTLNSLSGYLSNIYSSDTAAFTEWCKNPDNLKSAFANTTLNPNNIASVSIKQSPSIYSYNDGIELYSDVYFVDLVVTLNNNNVSKNPVGADGIVGFSNQITFSKIKITSLTVDNGVSYDTTTLASKLNALNTYSNSFSILNNDTNLLAFVKENGGLTSSSVDFLQISSKSFRTSSSGKLEIYLELLLSNSQTVSTNGYLSTQINVVNFSQLALANSLININDESKFNNVNLKSTIVNSNCGFTNVNLNLVSKTDAPLTVDPNYTNVSYNTYNFTFNLTDEYCFINNNNEITNSLQTTDGIRTNIVSVNMVTSLNNIQSNFSNLINTYADINTFAANPKKFIVDNNLLLNINTNLIESVTHEFSIVTGDYLAVAISFKFIGISQTYKTSVIPTGLKCISQANVDTLKNNIQQLSDVDQSLFTSEWWSNTGDHSMSTLSGNNPLIIDGVNKDLSNVSTYTQTKQNSNGTINNICVGLKLSLKDNYVYLNNNTILNSIDSNITTNTIQYVTNDTELAKAIGNINTKDALQDVISNPINLVKSNSLNGFSDVDTVLSSNNVYSNASIDAKGNVSVNITYTLNNGETKTASNTTQLKAVSVDSTTIIEKINAINDVSVNNNVNTSNFINTYIANSLYLGTTKIEQSNINNVMTINTIVNTVNSGNTNTYNYNININLKDTYIYVGYNTNVILQNETINNTYSINNVNTSIITYNLGDTNNGMIKKLNDAISNIDTYDKLNSAVNYTAQFISSISTIDNIGNIILPNTIVVTPTINGNKVHLNISVSLTDGQTLTGDADTNVTTVTFNESNLTSYVSQITDTTEFSDGATIATTLTTGSTNCGLTVGQVNPDTTSMSTNIVNDPNDFSQKTLLSLTIGLSSNCIYVTTPPSSSFSFTNSIQLNDLATNISVPNYTDNSLINYLLNNTINTYDDLNTLLNDPKQWIQKNGINSNWPTDSLTSANVSIQTSLSRNNNLIITMNIDLANSVHISGSGTTNLVGLVFNKTSFDTTLKSVSDDSQFNSNDHFINWLGTNANNFITTSSVLNTNVFSGSTITNSATPYSFDSVAQHYTKVYDGSIKLSGSSNFVFMDTSNPNGVSGSVGFENVVSDVLYTYDFWQLNPDGNIINAEHLFNAYFSHLSIENYTQYFDNANLAPGSDNTGTINVQKFCETFNANQTGGSLAPYMFNSVKFVRTGSNSSGHVVGKFTISMKTGFLYNTETSIGWSNVNTNIYDPNSNYNLEMFSIDQNGSLTGLNKSLIEQRVGSSGTLYVPWKVITASSWVWKNCMGNTKIGTFIFNYSQFCPDYTQRTYAFNNLNCDKVINNSPKFTYGNGYTDPDAKTGVNLFFNSSLGSVDFSNSAIYNICWQDFAINPNQYSNPTLTEVNFSNCQNLQIIGRTAFWAQTKLVRADFSNCNNLTKIGRYAFEDCTSLQEIDFSGCPITSISSDVFKNCTSLRKIYIDRSSQSIFMTALSNAGFDAGQIGNILGYK